MLSQFTSWMAGKCPSVERTLLTEQERRKCAYAVSKGAGWVDKEDAWKLANEWIAAAIVLSFPLEIGLLGFSSEPIAVKAPERVNSLFQVARIRSSGLMSHSEALSRPTIRQSRSENL
jgi:hypothetical protein